MLLSPTTHTHPGDMSTEIVVGGECLAQHTKEVAGCDVDAGRGRVGDGKAICDSCLGTPGSVLVLRGSFVCHLSGISNEAMKVPPPACTQALSVREVGQQG